jgi:hypothetical protein
MVIGVLANVYRMLLLLAATRVSWPCSRGINLQQKKNSCGSMQSSSILEPNATRTKIFVDVEFGRLRSWNSGHSLSVTRNAIVFVRSRFLFLEGGRYSSCLLLSNTLVSFQCSFFVGQVEK